MSEGLEHEIQSLRSVVEQLTAKPQATLLTKYIGPILTVTILAVGIIGTWFTMKANMETIEQKVTKLEHTVEKQDTIIEDIKLKAVQEYSDLAHIKEKVDKMDDKLDQLLESR